MHIGYATWLGTEGLKTFVTTSGLAIQRNDEGVSWLVFAFDGGVVHECRIQKDASEEQTDFEASFASMTGRPLTATKAYDSRVTPVPKAPVSSDGKPFVLPNMFPGEVLISFASTSDNSSGRFQEGVAGLQQVGGGDTSIDIVFNDGYCLAGGYVEWTGGAWGSYMEMSVVAPASTTKAPVVANQGNCNLVQLGNGAALIVPAAGNGVYDLEVATPIPFADDESNTSTGYWNYAETWVGKGVLTPGTPGASSYGLLNFQKTLHTFLAKVHLFQEGPQFRVFQLNSVKPKWILPEWKLHVKAHNAGTGTLQVGWNMTMARRRSV